MMRIKHIQTLKIKDSRNQPTIEVTVNNEKASSPSGKSTGKYETHSYHKSLEWNIKAINQLKISFEINSFDDLKNLEDNIKKTFKLKNAKQFGANALFALESAILKALAKSKNKQLWQIINASAKKFPVPVGNAIGGGLHSHNKDHPEFQEFLLIPKERSVLENVKLMNNIYNKSKQILEANSKNDEGAWQTSLSNEQILEILSKFKEINLGIDIAATSFHKNTSYIYKNKVLTRDAQIYYINSLIKKYNLLYIEDPLQEEDFQGFSQFQKSSKHLIIGDDLTATQIPRLEKAIKNRSVNAMIIKPNQNGSLIELKEIFDMCKKHNIRTILSHRSGETLDTSLADYAFAFQADFIKCGISTKWREVKLKRLIDIEKQIRKNFVVNKI